MSDPPSRIELLDERIEQISKFCDGIHVTDSVLGIERISPLLIGAEIKQKHPKLIVTISLRVIDKTISEITDIVDSAINANIDGILILMGDPSPENDYKSGVIPSFAVKHLIQMDLMKKSISFYRFQVSQILKKFLKKWNLNQMVL